MIEVDNSSTQGMLLSNKHLKREWAFLLGLKKAQPNACVLLTVPPSKKDECPPPLDELADKVVKDNPVGRDEVMLLTKFMDSMTFSKIQLQELEKLTKDQANSKVWIRQRIGRITSSNFHDVVTKVQSIPAARNAVKSTPLIAKMMRPRNLDNVLAIKWGKDKERNARNAFFKFMEPQHKNLKLHISGLQVPTNAPFVAASPDNLITCSCCEKCCVDYKCPYVLKDKGVQDGWRKVHFLEKCQQQEQEQQCQQQKQRQQEDQHPGQLQEKQQIRLKRQHKYYTQIQGQMAVTLCRYSYTSLLYDTC